ncbi:MAG: hypothetical protein SWK76_08860 [Actinomycetota bacterium]|nr:hypothetical protein [Actinomycetota bacterium]
MIQGSLSESGMVLGTYVHGLFDNAPVRMGFVEFLFERKGLKPPEATLLWVDDSKEERFDNLASEVRDSLDMDRIYRILKGGSRPAPSSGAVSYRLGDNPEV